mgnify:CR=1 FL=1
MMKPQREQEKGSSETPEPEVSRAWQGQHGGESGHDHQVLNPRGQGRQTLMVQAAIVAEEECKSILHTGGVDTHQ